MCRWIHPSVGAYTPHKCIHTLVVGAYTPRSLDTPLGRCAYMPHVGGSTPRSMDTWVHKACIAPRSDGSVHTCLMSVDTSFVGGYTPRRWIQPLGPCIPPLGPCIYTPRSVHACLVSVDPPLGRPLGRWWGHPSVGAYTLRRCIHPSVGAYMPYVDGSTPRKMDTPPRRCIHTPSVGAYALRSVDTCLVSVDPPLGRCIHPS